MGTVLPLVVVSVAYHSQSPLTSLAADLGRQSQRPLHWLVVDNAPQSAPLDPVPLQDVLGEVPLRLLRGQEGAGFAAGCNAAFEHLQRQGHRGWIWLLNPDIRLPEGDELDRLQIWVQQRDPRSVMGTAVRDDFGQLEASAGWIDPGLNFRRRRIQASQVDSSLAPLAVDWLSGCSLILCPTAHQPPARFDPGYPLYYEDLDLSRRLAASGAPLLWLPAPELGHQRGEGSRTPSSRRLHLSTRSYCRYLHQHCARWVQVVRLLRLLLTALLRLPLQPKRGWAVLSGIRVAG